MHDSHILNLCTQYRNVPCSFFAHHSRGLHYASSANQTSRCIPAPICWLVAMTGVSDRGQFGNLKTGISSTFSSFSPKRQIFHCLCRTLLVWISHHQTNVAPFNLRWWTTLFSPRRVPSTQKNVWYHQANLGSHPGLNEHQSLEIT